MKKLLLMVALPLALVSGAIAQDKKNTDTGKKTVVEMVATSPEHSTLTEAVKTAGLAETLRGAGPFTIFAPTNTAFAKLADDLDWDEAKRNPTNMDTTANRTLDMDTMTQNRTTQDTSMQNRPNWDTTNQNRPYRDTLTNQDRSTPTMRDTTPTMGDKEIQEKNRAVLLPENQNDLKTILQYHVVRGNYDSKALAQAVKAGNGKAVLTTVQGEKLTVKMQGNNLVLEDARGANATIMTADLKGSNGVIHVIDQVALPKKENTMER